MRISTMKSMKNRKRMEAGHCLAYRK